MGKQIGGASWIDDEQLKAKIGEGISRPVEGAKTRKYILLVRLESGQPMRVTLWAETKRHALKYGKNRWPTAAVEVLANQS